MWSFPLIEDILYYESTSTPGSADLTLGKPGGADLQLGLATGPALYAWEEFPEMGELIGRKFEGPGDVEMVCFVCFLFPIHFFSSLRFSFTMNRILSYPLSPSPSLSHFHPSFTPTLSRANTHTLQARSLVLRSSGVHRTKLLAKAFAEKAKEVLEELPESVAKSGLVALTERVIGRRS